MSIVVVVSYYSSYTESVFYHYKLKKSHCIDFITSAGLPAVVGRIRYLKNNITVLRGKYSMGKTTQSSRLFSALLLIVDYPDA